MKILVPVDGSPYTKRMLAYLAVHDEWLGSHHAYTLLHVVAAVPMRAASMLDKGILLGYYGDQAEAVFKPIRSFFAKQGIQGQFVSKTGNAPTVIADMAKKGRFDLIMLGSHGHGSLTNLVMGSVATKVLAQCQTPTLLIR